MSEYQFLAFRAVDRPLTNRELVYARQQSTRAEITRWYFENEYHFGDFGGNADGLLRYGYDAHLHYANFGIRKIAFRLPNGLPFPKPVWAAYFGVEGLNWTKDRNGSGGILTVDPYHEPDDLEEIWSPGDYLDEVVKIRNQLIVGDLRVLYVLWICAAYSDQSVSPEIIEPPVPVGIAECAAQSGPLMRFFGLDPLILAAASEDAPPPPAQGNHQSRFDVWIDALGDLESKRLLRRLLVEDAAVVKAEMLAAARDSGPTQDWPTVSPGREFGELLKRTDALRAEHDENERKKRAAAARRKAAKQERVRQDRLTKMVQSPDDWLREAEELVAARGTRNYKAAAQILADLRDAIGGHEGEQITRQHAAHLTEQHPTLTHLKSTLRKSGLLD